MNKDLLPEIIFKYIPFILVALWIIQALHSIILYGPFTSFRVSGFDFLSNTLHVGTGKIHALTALISFSFIFVVFILVKHIPLPHRTVVSVSLPVLGLLFYDTVHSTADFFLTGRGNPLILAVFFASCYLIIHFYNLKYNFLHFNNYFTLFFGIFCLTFLLLILNGFFLKLYLYDTAGGVNPHDWLWVLTKFFAVWMWGGCLIKK